MWPIWHAGSLSVPWTPKSDFLAGLDLNRLAGRRIAPHASRPLSNLQDPEPRNSDSFALLQMLGDQSDKVVEEFAPRPFCQLVLFGQACGELGKRNRNLVGHLFPPRRARIALSERDMIRKKKETRHFATMRLIFKLVSEAKFTEIRRYSYTPRG